MTKIKLLLYLLAILIFIKGCEVVPFGDWSNPVDSLNSDELVLSEVKNFSGTPGNGEVILTWSNPEDDNFDHVEIWYGIGNTDTEYTGNKDNAGTTILELFDNTEYIFKIKSVDYSNVYKSDGIEISVSTLNTLPPGEVTGLNIISGDEYLTLSWTNPTDQDFDHVEILYGIDDTNTVYEGIKNPNGTDIVGLLNNVEYTIIIMAVDKSGNKSNGIEVSATPAELIPPVFEGISNLQIISDTSIMLTWLQASDSHTSQENLQYNIYMSQNPGEYNWEEPIGVVTGQTYYTVEDLAPFTTYYFIIRCEDIAGNEDTNQKEISGKTTDSIAPMYNGIQSISPLSTSSVEIVWIAAYDNVTPSSEIVYQIYMAIEGGSQDYITPLATITGEESIVINNLDGYSTYYFVVRASDQSGNQESNNNEISVTTLENIPPVFSGALNASDESSYNSITLYWETATDNTTEGSNIKYNIYYSTTQGEYDFSNPIRVITGNTEGTVYSLSALTTYYFIVRAQDEAGNEDANQIEVSATTITDLTVIRIQVNTYTSNVTVGNDSFGYTEISFPSFSLDPITRSALVKKDDFYTISWYAFGNNPRDVTYFIGDNDSYKFIIDGYNISKEY